jgi:5-methyltetrahydropteroyltriglutamate--homocysteine methyltransferase
MQRSTDRILTTHVGSLPRPPDLIPLLLAKDCGQPYDAADLARRVRESVQAVVAKQAALGIDVLNDGEHSKSSFVAYPYTRLGGFEPTERPIGSRVATRDALAFPGVYEEMRAMYGARPSKVGRTATRPALVCTGPITYVGQAQVQEDIANLTAAMQGVTAAEGFVTALSPNNLALNYRNEYYRTNEEYLFALADAMREEYRAIVEAGFVLQIDDPWLATHYDRSPNLSLEECRRAIATGVEAVNHALRGLPAEQVRFHTCYSTNVAPRVHDMELRDFVDLMLQIRAAAYSFEASNPRHEHEWQVWEDVKLPEEKVLIPGVVTHCSTLVEHPELVAQRIARFAGVVGRERVLASNDCGFATSAAGDEPHPDVAWAKLQALAEGARLASRQLWG